MKPYFLFLLLAACPFAASNAQPLDNVTDVRMSAAVVKRDGNNIILRNVRAISSTTTLNDYLIATYPADKTSLDLLVDKVTIFPSVGTFNEDELIFLRDVTTPPTMTYGGATYSTGNSASFNNIDGLTPFVFDLKVGTSFGFHVFSTSSPLQILISDVNSRTSPKLYGVPTTPLSVNFSTNSSLHYYPILKSGKYYIWMKPTTSTTANVSFAFFNENPTLMNSTPYKTSTSVSTLLRGRTRDYGKWKFSLTKNQDIRINQTSGTNITWRLFSADGAELSWFSVSSGTSGTLLLYKDLPANGVYFVTAEKPYLNTGNTTLNATIAIEP